MIRGGSGHPRTVTGRSADGRTFTIDDTLVVAPDPGALVTVIEPTEVDALVAIFTAFPTSTILET